MAIHLLDLTQKDKSKQSIKRYVLTSSVLLQLPKGPQQSLVALVAFIVLGVQQDLLGINKQTGDTGDVQEKKKKKRPDYTRCLHPLRI